MNRILLAFATLCGISFAAASATAAPPAADGPSTNEPVTFNKHVAKIVFENCVKCHRPGEVAPFSLTSYADVAKRAELIAEVVGRHAMPPWKPVAGLREFSNGRRLTDAEITVIQKWAKSGAAEGAASDLPPLPKFTAGWQLGPPDVIVEMSEAAQIPADGRDIYLNVLLPLKVPTGKYIRAIEFHPGNKRVVHHAVLFYDESGKSRERDEAEKGLGFRAGTPPGKLLPGTLPIWTPGRNPLPLDDGFAMAWPEKADLVLNLHLHPSGKSETEKSTVGVYFTDKPPTRRFVDIMMIDRKIDIAPGVKEFKTHDERMVPTDLELHSIFPHMHIIGKEITLSAEYPDGKKETLFKIDDWDFNWQDAYEFAEPVRLPRGTKLSLDGIHDNSADNPQNPSSPPIRVRWGEQTLDEMSLAFLNLVPINGGLSGSDVAMGGAGMRGGSSNGAAKLGAAIRAVGDMIAGKKPAAPQPVVANPVDYTERARATMKKIDTDGNGRLSFAEVVAAVGNKHPKETVEKTLARFDGNGDRELDLTETASALKVLQP
jgi:hypothetical protein